MKRWRGMTILAGIGIVLTIGLLWPSDEPIYRGRSLSSWLRGFESESMEARQQSAEAVRQIGTNALPPLIALLYQPISRNEPRWRSWLRGVLSKQSFLKFDVPRAPDLRTEALAALHALGPMAKEAVPALERTLYESPPDHRSLVVLAGIGPAGVPTLTRALTNSEKVVRHGAFVCLEKPSNVAQSNLRHGGDSDFIRKTCELNLQILRIATEDYRAQHPEAFSDEGAPQPSLPPDFIRPQPPQADAKRTDR